MKTGNKVFHESSLLLSQTRSRSLNCKFSMRGFGLMMTAIFSQSQNHRPENLVNCSWIRTCSLKMDYQISGQGPSMKMASTSPYLVRCSTLIQVVPEMVIKNSKANMCHLNENHPIGTGCWNTRGTLEMRHRSSMNQSHGIPMNDLDCTR